VSTVGASVDLLPTLLAPRAARRVVVALLDSWGAQALHQDAELLVTEIVSNAVEHARGEATLLLELTLSDRWLRVALTDGSAVRPIVHQLSSERRKGWGMFIVEQLATRWGVEDHHGGKRVWFELMPRS
jgi:anti-sigma regulatory factor (Ser/Thr protein kinase)